MRRLFGAARSSVLAVAAVAVLSIAGIATANRAIRDNTVNTRDIKDNQVNTRDLRNGSITTRDIRDNQVNTRDLRDGAIRGVDVRDGSLGISELSAEAVAEAQAASLLDPRAHDQDDNGDGKVDNPGGSVAGHACCPSWAQGPTQISEVVAASANPLPGAGDGRAWRAVVLDPGFYSVQSTGRATGAEAGSEGVATRLFLGGKPLHDGGGYSFYPVSGSAFPVSQSSSTVIEVPAGTAAQRQLVQRAASLGGAAQLSDNLIVSRATPR